MPLEFFHVPHCIRWCNVFFGITKFVWTISATMARYGWAYGTSYFRYRLLYKKGITVWKLAKVLNAIFYLVACKSQDFNDIY